MKTRPTGWKFPAAVLTLLIAAAAPGLLHGQSAPASAPANAPAASAPRAPVNGTSPDEKTQFPLPPLRPAAPPKGAIQRGAFDETTRTQNDRVQSPAPPVVEPAPGAEANTITVPVRPAAQYAVKRAQILLAEERRDPELLKGLFQDSDVQVRSRTARALGRIGYPGSAEVLAILLADPAPEVQAGAAWGALYLGKEAKPLVPDLKRVIASGSAARLPALETLIGLGDAENAPAVLQAIENSPELRPQLAGHLFHLDTPAVRVMLKTWARNGRDAASQTGALASLVRLKADDEAMYRELLKDAINEPAVWMVKGLGLAKTPAPETIAALESAAKREHDPMTRTEAVGQLLKNHRENIDTIEALLFEKDSEQLRIKLFDVYSNDCGISELLGSAFLQNAFNKKIGNPNAELLLKSSPFNATANHFHSLGAVPSISLLRRLRHNDGLCYKNGNNESFPALPSLLLTEFPPVGGSEKTLSPMLSAFIDGLPDNKKIADFNPEVMTYLNLAGRTFSQPRLLSSTAGSLIQLGESANGWLSSQSAEVVANAADTASHLKPEEINPKRLSGAALMKAYQRFSLKKAEDGPNTRLYIVRAAAACAEKQPSCLGVLKAALKDHVRTVQINAWERWPEKLQKSRPAWPKPNLPRPDYLSAETRLQSLLDHPPHFEVTTTQGKFTMLFTARGEAPLNVINFRTLVNKRYFDGISWHRVVPNFVVQAGDPRGDGSGGPGWMIPCEYNSFPYKAGTVGMALDGKDTGGSQWFITLAAQPHLDYHYTVLGQVDSGMETIYKLGEDDKIISIREISYEPGVPGIYTPPADHSAPPPADDAPPKQPSAPSSAPAPENKS
jgi:cyclophilin family peptidyl-prolyl cis-trans isomerase